MTSDAVRPFVVGLLFVYLLDPPVRWLAAHGIRRTFAILIVYVVAIVLIVELINLTITPLVDEIVRFLQDLPGLISAFQDQLARLSELYARLQIPDAVRDWIDGMLASVGEGGAPVVDLTAVFPILERRDEPDRRALRVHHPAGLGVLPAQGPRRAGGRVRSEPPAGVAVRYVGGDQDRRVGCSGNGSAPNSSSA